MRRILFAIWALAIGSLPLSAEPSSPNWQGWYAGIDGGWTNRNGDVTSSITGAASATSSHGWETGLYGGYDWRSGPWVFGLELDWTHSFISDAHDDVDMFSGRGRAGFVIGNVLIYGTAGIATENRFVYVRKTALGATELFSNEQQHTGLIAGGGLETVLAKNLTLRGEYLYFNGGREQYNFPAPAPFVSTSPSSSFDQSIFRAGLTYHFN